MLFSVPEKWSRLATRYLFIASYTLTVFSWLLKPGKGSVIKPTGQATTTTDIY